MADERFSIRIMTRPEVEVAVDWAAAEGWNPGLYDSDSFYAADPHGFLVGMLGEQRVAAISAVKYDDTFAFLGFYIVKPEFRGKGYGWQVWNAALANLAGRTVGLDGVVAQQDNYRKSGFVLAYRNIRYQGRGGATFRSDAGIVRLSEVPFATLCAYDRLFFPAPRARFLKSWIDQPQSRALGILRNGELAGYGVVRACRAGYKIGPLFADTPLLAEQLFQALSAQVPEGAPLFLDVPEGNPAALALVARHGMGVAFETARMYLGKAPELPMDRLFGVTTFELG